MKKFNLILILLIAQLSISAQFTMNYVGNGNYEFSSSYSVTDLHFYMFGDGYHSFEKDNRHQFKLNAAIENVIAYHSNPYNDDDPDSSILGTGTNGTTGWTDLAPEDMHNIVQIKTSWNLREDANNYFLLMIENKDDQNPWSGCVEFHYDSEATIINPSEIKDYYNGWFTNRTSDVSDYSQHGYSNKFVWEFDNLVEGEQRYIYIPSKCLLPAFSDVKTCAVIKTNGCNGTIPFPNGNDLGSGGNGSNTSGNQAVYELRSQVSAYPHDPNIITSECQTIYQAAAEVTVPYRIYFQNDGVDPVQNVTIDYFTSGVYTNIKLVGASHDVIMNWGINPSHNAYNCVNDLITIPGPDAVFLFKDIFLPGTNQAIPPDDYKETIGWVDFLVCYDMTKFDYDCLGNIIDIYFDYLEPISASYSLEITDTNNNMTCEALECPSLAKLSQIFTVPDDGIFRKSSAPKSQDFNFKLFPNPTEEFINIEVFGFENNITSLTIYDVHNIAYQRLELSNSNHTIDLSGFSSGIYYIKISNETDSIVKTFVKL